MNSAGGRNAAGLSGSGGLPGHGLAAETHQLRELAVRLRRAEKIALHEFAALAPQTGELFMSFNAFRGDLHIQAASKADDRANDRKGALVVGQTLNERTIDLDLVERHVAKVAQAGIAGAEIVQRQPNAPLLPPSEH